MNPLKDFGKIIEARNQEKQVNWVGAMEILARKIFGNNPEIVTGIDATFGDDAAFSGIDSSGIRILQDISTAAGISPLQQDLFERAEAARRKALNLKTVSPKTREILVSSLKDKPEIELNDGLKNSLMRTFESAIEDGTFSNLIQGYPNMIAVARDVMSKRSLDYEKYPYLLPLPKQRIQYGRGLASKEFKNLDPNILTDKDILNGFIASGGDTSKINTAELKFFEKNTEDITKNRLPVAFPQSSTEAEDAINKGLKHLNQQFTARKYLADKVILLRNNDLEIKIFKDYPGLNIPTTDKNTVDFTKLTNHDQKEYIRMLENIAIFSEFGTIETSPNNIVNDIKQMSLSELSRTNVAREVIFANGDQENFTRNFNPEVQRLILAKALSIRAIAYNTYTRNIDNIVIDSNANAVSGGIKEAQKASAVYVQVTKQIDTALKSNIFDTDDLKLGLAALKAAQKIDSIAMQGQGLISEAIGIMPADNINIINDEALLITNPFERERIANNLSLALSQIIRKEQSIRDKGFLSLQNILGIDYATCEKIVIKLIRNGSEIIKSKLIPDQNGNININYTKNSFLSERDKTQKKGQEKFNSGLESARSKIFATDFREITQTYNYESLNQFEQN